MKKFFGSDAPLAQAASLLRRTGVSEGRPFPLGAQSQHRERRQHARPREPPDRTSRPESPAIARMPDQRGCNGKPLCQPSRPPHEYGPGIRPKDATDKEARTRSRGRSVVVLYNCVRTHRSLNKDAPVSRPVQRTGVISSRAILGGLHHRYARV